MNLELQALPYFLKKTWDFSAVVSASVQPWSILKETALVHIKKEQTIEWNTPELASGHQCDPYFMTRGSQRLLWLIFVAESSTFSVKPAWLFLTCTCFHYLWWTSHVFLLDSHEVIFQIWTIIPSTHFCKNIHDKKARSSRKPSR